MNVISGFAGIHLEGDIPAVTPVLPEEITSIEVPFIWHGHRLCLKVDDKEISIDKEDDTPLFIRIQKTVYTLKKSITVARSSEDAVEA